MRVVFPEWYVMAFVLYWSYPEDFSGVSPFLTEREVFDCPSRTARLCDAFWEYAHRTHSDLE